jgi:hypothetical protein
LADHLILRTGDSHRDLIRLRTLQAMATEGGAMLDRRKSTRHGEDLANKEGPTVGADPAADDHARHPALSAAAARPGTGLTRRQLLQGVAQAGALSTLVTLASPAAAHAAPEVGTATSAQPEAATASDVLWLAGVGSEQQWFMEGVDGTGRMVGRVTGLLNEPIRSPTRESLFAVNVSDRAGQRQTQLRRYSALDGSLTQTILGPSFATGLAGALSTVTAAISSDEKRLAVLHTLTAQTVTDRVQKPAGKGEPTVWISVGPWRVWRAVEVFDLLGGAGSEAAVLDSPDGTLSAGEVAVLGDRVAVYGLWDAPTPPGADKSAAAAAAAGIRTTLTLLVIEGSQLRPSSAARDGQAGHDLGREGRVLFPGSRGRSLVRMTDVNILEFHDLDRATTSARLRVFADADQPARPYPTTALRFGTGRVVLVNAARRAAALVDLAGPAVLVNREIRTWPKQQAGYSPFGQGVAIDEPADRLYVADTSQVRGGIWVLRLSTLETVDRWLSSTSFDLVWAAESSHEVFAKASGSNLVMVFDGEGAVHGVAEVDEGVVRTL